MQVKVDGGVQLSKVKLNYLDGTNFVQGEAGAGFNFLTAKPLVDVGVNAPYSAFALDVSPGNTGSLVTPSLDPTLEVKTNGYFKKP